jgi:hypothetical protein
MAKSTSVDAITKKQRAFYNTHKAELIDKYLRNFPTHIDPDAIRDLFMAIGYDRSNVKEFQGICKIITKEIFEESLKRNKGKVKTVIFAAGLPASGKSSHLKTIAENELIYDGTVNDESKFIELIQSAINMGYSVEVFVYSADPKRAFKSNLTRGDQTGRYVPVSHYEKVANSINNREELLKKHFQNHVKFRNFEHTSFEGEQKDFSKIIIKRNELERIANRHKFANSEILREIIS